MAGIYDLRLVIVALLLAAGRSAAAPSLQLTPPPGALSTTIAAATDSRRPAAPPEPDNSTWALAANGSESVYGGRVSLVASLPTLSPADGGGASGNHRKTPTLRHSPLAGGLLTASPASSTGLTGGLRVQSFNMAAPGIGAAGIPGQAPPQVRGASASVSPLPGRPDRLTVVGASLYGPATQPAYGPLPQNGPEVLGRSWSVTSDSLFLDRTLRVQGQYVRTADRGGAGTGLGLGQAYDIGVAYLTPRGRGLGQGWNLELHHARIGPRLWTPRNPGLAKNVSLWQANASRQQGSLALGITCTREIENVDPLDGGPRTHLQLWESHLRYKPAHRLAVLGWLGQPVFALRFQRQLWQAQQSEADQFAGTDTVLTSGALNVRFRTLPPLAWHLNSSWTATDDRIADAQTLTHRYEVGMHISPGAGIQLVPTYALQSSQSDNQSDPSHTTTGMVSAQLPLLGGKAALHVNAEVDRFDPGETYGQSWQRTINGQFVWHATKAHGRRPAITLDLTGSHQWTSPNAGIGNWEVLASVNIRYNRHTD